MNEPEPRLPPLSVCADVGLSMYFIMSGMVRVVKGYGTADEREIAQMNRGNFFGERALTAAGGTERGATVVSLSLLKLQRLTRTSLEHVGQQCPELLASITKVANDRRRDLGEELRELGSIASQRRLAAKFTRRSLGDRCTRLLSRSKIRNACVQPMAPASKHGIAPMMWPKGPLEDAGIDSATRPLWTPGLMPSKKQMRAMEPEAGAIRHDSNNGPGGASMASAALQGSLDKILEQQEALASRVDKMQQKLDGIDRKIRSRPQ